MKSFYSEFKGLRSVIGVAMDHISHQRRRSQLRDTRDEDDLSPHSCNMSEERTIRVRRPSGRIVSFDKDIEEYEMISNEDSPLSSSNSEQDIPLNTNTSEILAELRSTYLSILDEPAEEAVRCMQSVQSKRLRVSQQPPDDNWCGVTTQQPSIRGSSKEQSPANSTFLAVEQSRKRAYSLSNAIANLRNLPWHIDRTLCEEENRYNPNRQYFSESPQLATLQGTSSLRSRQQEPQDTHTLESEVTASTNLSDTTHKLLLQKYQLFDLYPNHTERARQSTPVNKHRSPIHGSHTAHDLEFSLETSSLGDSWMNIESPPGSAQEWVAKL